jgi:hypothetical protein
MSRTIAQSYPRINDEDDKYYGFLDVSKLKQHHYKLTQEELISIINQSITLANKKSSRAILNIPDEADDQQVKFLYHKAGKELFNYFKKYYGDPATTAYDCFQRHYSTVAKEQFRNRTIQKERMNSGWRYQFIVKDSALYSKRFFSVSDTGTNEADFNALIELAEDSQKKINIYVSVKNRTNTMGGQDWPKAIFAIENMAKTDKNRSGPYICVFGIAMDKGKRLIKNEAKSKQPFSINTEIWLSDFFWPFFTNYKYEEIIKAVLDVLISKNELSNLDIEIPDELITSFGESCYEMQLLNSDGKFNDVYKLVDLFCGKL